MNTTNFLQISELNTKQLRQHILDHAADIAQWPTSLLNDCWQRLYPLSYRVPATNIPTLNKTRLVRALLWLVQAQLYGGLDTDTQQLLQHYQKQVLADHHNKSSADDKEKSKTTDTHLTQGHFKAKDLPIGTQLTRHWQGRDYEVTVIGPRAFTFSGVEYKSLSKIAEQITGTHWSGPRFFGLNQLI